MREEQRGRYGCAVSEQEPSACVHGGVTSESCDPSSTPGQKDHTHTCFVSAFFFSSAFFASLIWFSLLQIGECAMSMSARNLYLAVSSRKRGTTHSLLSLGLIIRLT